MKGPSNGEAGDALDRLEELHREEVRVEAHRDMRHAPRPLRVLRPSELPTSDRMRERLAVGRDVAADVAAPDSAAGVAAASDFAANVAAAPDVAVAAAIIAHGAPDVADAAVLALFVDPLRSSGPWLASLDDEPHCAVDVAAPFGGHAPLLLVRGYMEGDFGATLVGEDRSRATDELRRSLRARVPSLPHLELGADAADARALLARRLSSATDAPLLIVGELDAPEELDALGPHRVLPAPPPRLGTDALDALDEAALAVLEHALTERAAAVWLVALDAIGRTLSRAFILRAVELAHARRVPVVIDEAAFAIHAAGFVFAGGADLEVHARILGGPSLPGLVLARVPLAIESELVEPAALVRARLLLEGHDPVLATQAQAWLQTRLEALVGRFPDLALAPRAEGFVFGFELPTPRHRENLAKQLPLRGAHVGHAPQGHPRSIVGRLGLTWTVAEVDRLFDALRGALKWLEAHLDAHGEGPLPTETDLPTATRPPREHPDVETRVRVVSPEDADVLLDELVALEERVYEPARRDPRDKLALAFHDPAGVAVVAERKVDGVWKVVGGALAAPLERIRGVAGCDDDPLRADQVSLYSIGTTLDPACRGLGLGERMKAAVVDGAAAVRRRDGSPRFHWICGRMRVGATDAMARINRRLGASEVRRLRGQYEGGAEASYYRLPVRGFVAPQPRTSGRPDNRDPHRVTADRASDRTPERTAHRLGDGHHTRSTVVLHRPERVLHEAPEGLRAAAEIGLLFGPIVHGLTPGQARATTASLRAIEILRSLHPDHPHVSLAPSRRGALHRIARSFAAELVAFEGDDVADLRVRRLPHPADDLDVVLAQLERSPRSVLFVERVQARSGRVVPSAFFEALRARDLRFVAIERATFGGRHIEPPPSGARAILWGEGPLGVIHTSAPLPHPTSAPLSHPASAPLPLGEAGDELTLIRASYTLRAARALRLANAVDETLLDDALSPLASFATIRGEGLYRVAETELAPWLAASLRGHGFEPRARGPYLAFAPPLDLPEERYVELRAALRTALRG